MSTPKVTIKYDLPKRVYLSSTSLDVPIVDGFSHPHLLFRESDVTAPSSSGYCAIQSGCGNVYNRGGPVMHNAVNILDFWEPPGYSFDNNTIDPSAANPSDATYENLITRYFNDVCSDTHFYNILQQYKDYTGKGPGSCSYYNSIVDTRAFPELPLSEGDIQAEVQAAMNYFGLNAKGDTEVFVFTPYGVGSCAGVLNYYGCVPNTNWCAYHDWWLSTQLGALIYANIPDAGTPLTMNGTCLAPTGPNSDVFADSEISLAFHEQFESVTDPQPPTGYLTLSLPSYEIGDECAWNFPFEPDGSDVVLNGDLYAIQTIWSNSNHGCTLDLAGSPSKVSINLTADQGSGYITGAARFPILYQEAGESFPSSDLFNNQATIYVTPSS
ncbi:MAG: hypothetical protein ACRECH_15810, partial [Nitrososphaerales archaeon]